MSDTFDTEALQAPPLSPDFTQIPSPVADPPEYRVQSLGRSTQTAPPVTKWRTEAMRSHRHPVILWFTRGQGRITICGTTRGFGPHNLVFLPQRTMYGYEPVGQIMGTMVHLPNDPGLKLPQEPLHMRFRDVFQQQEITQLIDHLQREIEHENQPGRERALTYQAGIISVWLERQRALMSDDSRLPPDASHRLAAQFTTLIEAELTASRTIAQYADALGVTPTHLSRSCNAACGRSASALLSDRLHFEASRLLSETALPISEIAETLGFTSAAYFSRAFHKHTGQSPRDFRQTA